MGPQSAGTHGDPFFANFARTGVSIEAWLAMVRGIVHSLPAAVAAPIVQVPVGRLLLTGIAVP